MSRYIILLLILPFLVKSKEDVHEGSCPQPKTESKPRNLIKIPGIHWVYKSTQKSFKTENYKCSEVSFQDAYAYFMYFGRFPAERRRLSPTDDDRYGVWTSETYNNKTKEYKVDGWTFMTLKVLDNGQLMFACKEISGEDKHESYYFMISENTTLPKSEEDELMKLFKDNGGVGTFTKPNNKGCKHYYTKTRHE